MTSPRIPNAANNIQKGVPLNILLDVEAIECLTYNISLVHPIFDGEAFTKQALAGLQPLGLMERGQKLAQDLRCHLPHSYAEAVEILLASLTPPLSNTEDNGLAIFFYLPHVCFVARYGLDPKHNGGNDPFELSMKAQYQLTKRFSAEFSIRPFLIHQQERTLSQLMEWASDPDPHVRRLCSEGTRPRLPWAMRIPAFMKDPAPALPILEKLKDDGSLYVRRSVANHLGDIAKDNLEITFELCEKWLENATEEVKWLIRHAVRHPAKKGNETALDLLKAARPAPKKGARPV